MKKRVLGKLGGGCILLPFSVVSAAFVCFFWRNQTWVLNFFGSFLVLTLLLRPMVCQEQNKDEVFVFEFLQKMGLSVYDFSGSLCSWRGVVCDFNGENVVKLDASGLGLYGMIPDATIAKLVKLEYLDLSHNKITGLPDDFWSLRSLKTLNLSFNRFFGILPRNIGYFDQLQSLDLSYNNFSGCIPDAISSLVSLRALDLSHNSFDSTVPLEISQCWFLTSLDLSRNKLSGPLTKGFGTAFSGLKMLNLAGNRIRGRDLDFSGMESIRHLNISDNLFKGSVVHIFQGPLEVIDLSRNQFNGFIAHVNFSSSFNWSNLLYLDISENHFTGELFNELNNSVNLKHLNLAHNRFTRQMFLQVAEGSSLQYLNLSGTNLIGPIPDTISHMQNLQILDLSRNHLSGRVPSSVNKNLQFLDLSYNELTGVIPRLLIQELLEIERFNFSYNNLSYCGVKLSNKTVETAFMGSISICPISADPAFFRRKVPKHDTLKFAIYLSLSMICLLMVLLCLAFRSRTIDRMLAVKLKPYKDEESIAKPFSFKRDSTTWTAYVKQATSVPVVIFEKPLLNFTFADLLSATSHFDRAALLAEGRFGPVYRALLPGGIHVAVQVLVHGSTTMCDQDAARELEYLGRIKHPNLVPLAGYCLAGEQSIAIYEYMERGNLQSLLHTTPQCDQTTEENISEDNKNGIENVGSENFLTSWKFRYNIALGIARALAFLHHGCLPPMIHRNVKASSIYLDTDFEPRLSDFGLAKILGDGQEDEDSKGSPYMPPEFIQHDTSSPQAPSEKFDVYGYGVILFELITGKKPIEDDHPDDGGGNLVGWVRGLVRRKEESKAIDTKIKGTGLEAKMAEALKIGYLCTAENPWKRPTMHQVVGLLKDLEQVWEN